MRKPLASAVFLCWSVCGVGPSTAQPALPQVFAGAPAAPWISPPGATGSEFGVFHFRRVFELERSHRRFVVHVSADNRYRLFVNGEQVSSGPQRSDLMHWRYETVDLAPHLRAGRNVLAALVWNWGAERPVAQFSRRTAFLLQGDSPREAAVNSVRSGRCSATQGTRRSRSSRPRLAATTRRRRVRRSTRDAIPWGWEQLDFPEDGWVAAVAGEGFRAPRTQFVRAIPSARQAAGSSFRAPFRQWRSRRPDSPRCGGGGRRDRRRLPPRDERPRRARKDPRRPPARQGHLTNAYTVLATSGGAGSTVRAYLCRSPQGRAGEQGESQRHRRQGHRRRTDSSGPTAASVAASRRSGSGPTATCRSRSRRETRRSASTICTASSPPIRSSSSPVSTAICSGSATCGRSIGAAPASARGRPTSTPPTTSSSSTWATPGSRR